MAGSCTPDENMPNVSNMQLNSDKNIPMIPVANLEWMVLQNIDFYQL